ncbi:phosphoglucosamine mutase [Pseudoclavibacter sp. CFCC 11306]|uniref:phosphoglucosamine mutase n=1 Tax=Pseudoclavibacter sp. CFCC 11306 TaxID=1564493 RepID=UPI0013013140|nr:phosphoglucosamine mutase [Pseudoclavibacter sp. CFCC 11306]KAB1658917.1 phosphoglucosamine mutase [Pseudoclavibacter sp. CFCC 11306]
MPRLFGTDGVRGLANRDLTVELSLQLAQAAARVLGAEARAAGRRPMAVLGRDPRISGEFIGAAVAAGLASGGVDVHDAGVLPTPATAFLVQDLQADFGVMISASHNPAPDNGIKFFAKGGLKLPDEVEDKIEVELDQPKLAPTGADVGRISTFADAEDRYLLHLLGTVPNSLGGIRLALDCANGAAAGVSPQAFTDAGAKLVRLIGADPNGLNINDGVGSTHLEKLQEAVIADRAQVGIAHDGDADRCLAIDENGRVIDGDQIMAILATALHRRRQLPGNTLVCTVMSNLGLHLAMQKAGIEVRQTAVGDRYVLEELNRSNLGLGGEQSGHVIFRRYATTGDGLLTGLQLLSVMAETGKPLSVLADEAMTVYPQTLINVRGVDKTALSSNAVIKDAVTDAEAQLGDEGRVLLRPSGTEPLVRVMVEATSERVAHDWAEKLAAVVREQLTVAAA